MEQAGRPQITEFGRCFGRNVPKAIHTHGPNATPSVPLHVRYHGTGKRGHGTERGVKLSRITVPRGTGMGREYAGWVSMVSGVSVM